jgi:hypothetical protein
MTYAIIGAGLAAQAPRQVYRSKASTVRWRPTMSSRPEPQTKPGPDGNVAMGHDSDLPACPHWRATRTWREWCRRAEFYLQATWTFVLRPIELPPNSRGSRSLAPRRQRES